MELDKIVREQGEFIALRVSVIALLQGYESILNRWESIEEQIKMKWLENLEIAFRKLFVSKGFEVTEQLNELSRKVYAKLGCCQFYMTFTPEGKGNVCFGVINPELQEGAIEKSIDDIQYKLLLEGPMNKHEEISIDNQRFGLMLSKDISQLKNELEKLTLTLRELKTLESYIKHNKASEEHYINNQNKLKLITTSTQYGVFHTLEELIERM